MPFAVVSGSTRASVTASLSALDLLNRFEALVCAEDYARPKPDPEGYLLAARLLGVDPADCLVFEDTELGVAAARAAGMEYVLVPPPWQR
ncbi:HAD family hydrolase [Actinoplanes philippinensis]|uniref:HAD family hydrolase n=1 Tax=Actinoplanes philippinensis TaxID=35752 RepID=UPI0033C8BDAC